MVICYYILTYYNEYIASNEKNKLFLFSKVNYIYYSFY